MSSGLGIVQDAVGRTESCPDNQPFLQDGIHRGRLVAPKVRSAAVGLAAAHAPLRDPMLA
jgi:hypothetical protein